MDTIEQRPLTPWRTSSGLWVGGAYIRPPARMSADAELVQTALIGKRIRGHDRADWLIMAACMGAVVTLALMAWKGWL